MEIFKAIQQDAGVSAEVRAYAQTKLAEFHKIRDAKIDISSGREETIPSLNKSLNQTLDSLKTILALMKSESGIYGSKESASGAGMNLFMNFKTAMGASDLAGGFPKHWIKRVENTILEFERDPSLRITGRKSGDTSLIDTSTGILTDPADLALIVRNVNKLVDPKADLPEKVSGKELRAPARTIRSKEQARAIEHKTTGLIKQAGLENRQGFGRAGRHNLDQKWFGVKDGSGLFASGLTMQERAGALALSLTKDYNLGNALSSMQVLTIYDQTEKEIEGQRVLLSAEDYQKKYTESLVANLNKFIDTLDIPAEKKADAAFALYARFLTLSAENSYQISITAPLIEALGSSVARGTAPSEAGGLSPVGDQLAARTDLLYIFADPRLADDNDRAYVTEAYKTMQAMGVDMTHDSVSYILNIKYNRERQYKSWSEYAQQRVLLETKDEEVRSAIQKVLDVQQLQGNNLDFATISIVGARFIEPAIKLFTSPTVTRADYELIQAQAERMGAQNISDAWAGIQRQLNKGVHKEALKNMIMSGAPTGVSFEALAAFTNKGKQARNADEKGQKSAEKQARDIASYLLYKSANVGARFIEPAEMAKNIDSMFDDMGFESKNKSIAINMIVAQMKDLREKGQENINKLLAKNIANLISALTEARKKEKKAEKLKTIDAMLKALEDVKDKKTFEGISILSADADFSPSSLVLGINPDLVGAAFMTPVLALFRQSAGAISLTNGSAINRISEFWGTVPGAAEGLSPVGLVDAESILAEIFLDPTQTEFKETKKRSEFYPEFTPQGLQKALGEKDMAGIPEQYRAMFAGAQAPSFVIETMGLARGTVPGAAEGLSPVGGEKLITSYKVDVQAAAQACGIDEAGFNQLRERIRKKSTAEKMLQWDNRFVDLGSYEDYVIFIAELILLFSEQTAESQKGNSKNLKQLLETLSAKILDADKKEAKKKMAQSLDSFTQMQEHSRAIKAKVTEINEKVKNKEAQKITIEDFKTIFEHASKILGRSIKDLGFKETASLLELEHTVNDAFVRRDIRDVMTAKYTEFLKSVKDAFGLKVDLAKINPGADLIVGVEQTIVGGIIFAPAAIGAVVGGTVHGAAEGLSPLGIGTAPRSEAEGLSPVGVELGTAPGEAEGLSPVVDARLSEIQDLIPGLTIEFVGARFIEPEFSVDQADSTKLTAKIPANYFAGEARDQNLAEFQHRAMIQKFLTKRGMREMDIDFIGVIFGQKAKDAFLGFEREFFINLIVNNVGARFIEPDAGTFLAKIRDTDPASYRKIEAFLKEKPRNYNEIKDWIKEAISTKPEMLTLFRNASESCSGISAAVAGTLNNRSDTMNEDLKSIQHLRVNCELEDEEQEQLQIAYA